MLIDRAPQQIRLTNYVATLTNLIGAHEHESHYVFDLCYHNTIDIAPTIITADMHSINKMNFAAMYWFEMDFAPRFTNLQAQLQHLFFGDDNIEQDDNFLIKPAGQIDLPAICDDPCEPPRGFPSGLPTSNAVVLFVLPEYSVHHRNFMQNKKATPDDGRP
ncbi:Tn3 family transposase [Paraburkholderia sp. BR14320]|uniref:Tn3 family transposase n=1 Tax=unclassified Paraburkholderia TaxID=2615204 RepID=UPI0034CD8492